MWERERASELEKREAEWKKISELPWKFFFVKQTKISSSNSQQTLAQINSRRRTERIISIASQSHALAEWVGVCVFNCNEINLLPSALDNKF